MPLLKLTPADKAKNMPMEPAWYPTEAISCETKPSADGKSVNFVFTFRFKDGREMEHNFNSKAMGFAQPFVEAVEKRKLEPGTIDEVDTDNLLHKPVNVKVENEAYQGRLISKIKDFLPIDANLSNPF